LSRHDDARVTVIMPVRNGGAYLEGAIASILGQTARAFRLLILDDGSDDGSLELARRLADERTEILSDGRRLGLVARLNAGLDLARTPFVARMDADDIAAPGRLARQLAFMEANPGIGICGSCYIRLEEGRAPVRVNLPTDHDSLRAVTLFSSPFAHPTVMFSMRHLDGAGLRYTPQATHAEDYDLWERASGRLRLANVPEHLLFYRLHAAQVSHVHALAQSQVTEAVRRRALNRLGIDPSDAELALHGDIAAGRAEADTARIEAATAWLERIADTARRRAEMAIARDCAARARALRRRRRSPLRAYLGRMGNAFARRR